ncbi:V-type proton ATPase subunit S1 [Chionoecetes opilio]|uniref:V-type proton ATPase subunit S1 n=1 Tax=Chionoecetes opilio TaxID=41210 RepID=A0A8J5CZM8_CHIOP|nr:V-type proton ATPase subunit S1 [Chionoecetes opilio]
MAGTSVILLLCSLFCGILAKERVPVLVWNYSQVHRNYPAVPALQSIDYATFQSKYLAAFEPKNIMLFLQDALSIEDLSSHATEFAAVKRWMGDSHNLYLPNVEEPAHLAHDLPSRGYNVVSLEPGVPAAGLDLKQQDNNLVVVKLPSTLTNPSRRRALQKAVEVMQNVISKIGAKRDFTFIFTGIKPSMEDSSKKYKSHVRLPRAAVMPQEQGYHEVNCVKLYLKDNFTLTVYDNKTSSGDPTTIQVSGKPTSETGHCDDVALPERKAQLVMKYHEGVGSFSKIIFTFNYKAFKGSWAFTDVEVLLNNSIEVHYLELVSPDITGIPVGMSYSCSQTIYLASNDTTPGNNIAMTMDGIQMEAFFFKNNTGSFGPAWDCVGFFTVPIWVSLLTTLLLLTILSMGLYMLSDIKTMDRFDDPKGQPIMVPTSD